MNIRAFTTIASATLVSTLCMTHAANALEVKDTFYFDKDSAGVSSGGYTSSRTEGYTFIGTEGLATTVSGWFGDSSTGITNASQYLKHWSGLSLDRPSNNAWDDDYGTDGNGNGNDSHSVDNSGYDDFVVFEFSEAVSLHSYSFGWTENDSDSTVMYLTGPGTANSTLSGTRLDDAGANSLTSKGWSALSRYSQAPVRSKAQHDAGNASVAVATAVASKVWAVAAYLVTMDTNNNTWSHGNDGFKLSALTVSRTVQEEVPVPATLALLALGGLLLRSRRNLANAVG